MNQGIKMNHFKGRQIIFTREVKKPSVTFSESLVGKNHSNVSTMSRTFSATPRQNIIFHSNCQRGINVIGFKNFLVPDVAATSFANLNIELQLQDFVNTMTEFTFIFLCLLTWFMRVFLSPVWKDSPYWNQKFLLTIQWA